MAQLVIKDRQLTLEEQTALLGNRTEVLRGVLRNPELSFHFNLGLYDSGSGATKENFIYYASTAGITGNYAYPEYVLPEYLSILPEVQLEEYLSKSYPYRVVSFVLRCLQKGYDYTFVLANFQQGSGDGLKVYDDYFISWIQGNFDIITSQITDNVLTHPSRSQLVLLEDNQTYAFNSPLIYSNLSMSFERVSYTVRSEYFGNFLSSIFANNGGIYKVYYPVLCTLIHNGIRPRDLEGIPLFTSKVMEALSSDEIIPINHYLQGIFQDTRQYVVNRRFRIINYFGLIRVRDKLHAIYDSLRRNKVDIVAYGIYDDSWSYTFTGIACKMLQKGIDVRDLLADGFSFSQISVFYKYVKDGLDFKSLVYDVRYSPYALDLIRKGFNGGKDFRPELVKLGDEFGTKSTQKELEGCFEEFFKDENLFYVNL